MEIKNQVNIAGARNEHTVMTWKHEAVAAPVLGHPGVMMVYGFSKLYRPLYKLTRF